MFVFTFKSLSDDSLPHAMDLGNPSQLIKLELKFTHIGWFLLPGDKMISSQVHLLLRVWYSENLFPIFPWKRKYCYNLCHLNHAG